MATEEDIDMSTPMTAGNSYTDAQGTQYAVAPFEGGLIVAVTGRKFWQIQCDAARLSDDRLFQFQLSGTNLWMQQTFAPMSMKFPVPA